MGVCTSRISAQAAATGFACHWRGCLGLQWRRRLYRNWHWGCASGRSGLARSWARQALLPNEIPSRNTSWIFSEYCCGFQAGKFVCLFGESCKDMPITRKSAVYSKNQGSITANLKKHLKKPVFILGSLGSTGPLNVDAERRKMPCAMRAGAVIYSSVFRARC